MRFQFSPSRNRTRILHDDGRVEEVEGRVGADGGVSNAPADGQFYDPEAHPQQAIPQSEAAALSLADGVTARHTDELGGVVDTARDYLKGDLGGFNPQVQDVLGRYEQHVARNRVHQDQARKQHPGTSLAMEMGGSLAGPIGKVRGLAGAAGAGAAYGVGDSTGQDFGQVAEDGMKGLAVGAGLGYVGGKVAPKVGAALERGAYKTLQAVSKPVTARRLVGHVGVGNAVGAGIGGAIGGPVGAMMGTAAASSITPYIAKGVARAAGRGAKAMEHAAAKRQLQKPHTIMTHEDPMFPTSEKASATLLRDDLLKAGGGRPQGVSGKYVSRDLTEHGQMVPHLPPSQAARLGQKYGQESVVMSGGGNNALLYTNGPNAGKAIQGQGTTFYDEDPGLYFSTMKNPLSGKPTHFSHNLDFDAGPQTFDARKVTQGASPKASAGGVTGAAVAAGDLGPSNQSPEERANRSVAQKLVEQNVRSLHDKKLSGKLNEGAYTEATVALKWIAQNVKNPYYAKQAMEKVTQEPQSAKQIIGGLQEGMRQSGQQEQGMWKGRF